MSTVQHTPWRVEPGVDRQWIVDDIGTSVCGVEDKPRAELIVRAVNSHDDLLAACKALRGRIESRRKLIGGFDLAIDLEVLNLADKAIAKATPTNAGGGRE